MDNEYDEPLDLSQDRPQATGAWQDSAEEDWVDGGIYRSGDKLVVERGVDLPPICIKTNVPTDKSLNRTLAWHHPAAYLGLLLGVLPYAIFALATQRKVILDIPLSSAVISRRKIWIGIGLAMMFLGFGLLITGLVFIADENRSNDGQAGYLAATGGILLFIDLFVSVYISSLIVRATKITQDHIWIAGANKEYLDRFPKY